MLHDNKRKHLLHYNMDGIFLKSVQLLMMA